MPDEKSFNYFLDNKDKLLQQYPGMYLVLKDGKIKGIYPDEISAEANAPKHGKDLLILHLHPQGITEYKLKSN